MSLVCSLGAKGSSCWLIKIRLPSGLCVQTNSFCHSLFSVLLCELVSFDHVFTLLTSSLCWNFRGNDLLESNRNYEFKRQLSLCDLQMEAEVRRMCAWEVWITACWGLFQMS